MSRTEFPHMYCSDPKVEAEKRRVEALIRATVKKYQDACQAEIAPLAKILRDLHRQDDRLGYDSTPPAGGGGAE